MTYESDELFRQISYVAYHFHWPFDQIAQLDHATRLRFVDEIGRINTGANTAGEFHG